MWEDLTDLFAMRVLHHTWAARGNWGLDLAAYSQILILYFLCKSQVTIDGVLPPLGIPLVSWRIAFVSPQ